MFRIYSVVFLLLTTIVFSNKIIDSIDKNTIDISSYIEYKINGNNYLILLTADFQDKDITNQITLSLYKQNENIYEKIISKNYTELNTDENNWYLSKTNDKFFKNKLLKCYDINDKKKIIFIPMVYGNDKSLSSYGSFLIENDSIYFLTNFTNVISISKINNKIILKTKRYYKDFEIILNDYISDYNFFNLSNLEKIDEKDIGKYESYTFNIQDKNYAVVYVAKDYINNTHNIINSYDLFLYQKISNKYEKIDTLDQSTLPKHIRLGVINYKYIYKIKNLVPFFNNKIFKLKFLNNKPTIIFPIFFGDAFNIAIFSIENNKIVFKEEIADIKTIIEERNNIKITFQNEEIKNRIL